MKKKSDDVEIVAMRSFLYLTRKIRRGDVLFVPADKAQRFVESDAARYFDDPEWQIDILTFVEPKPVEYWDEAELKKICAMSLAELKEFFGEDSSS